MSKIIDKLKKGVLHDWKDIEYTLIGDGRFEGFSIVEDVVGNKLTIKTLNGCTGKEDLVVFEDVPSEILISELNYIFSGSSSFLYSLIGLRYDIWEVTKTRIGKFTFQKGSRGRGYTYQLILGDNGFMYNQPNKGVVWEFSIMSEVIKGDTLGTETSEVELSFEIIVRSEILEEKYTDLIQEIRNKLSNITIKIKELEEEQGKVIKLLYRTGTFLSKDQYKRFNDIVNIMKPPL